MRRCACAPQHGRQGLRPRAGAGRSGDSDDPWTRIIAFLQFMAVTWSRFVCGCLCRRTTWWNSRTRTGTSPVRAAADCVKAPSSWTGSSPGLAERETDATQVLRGLHCPHESEAAPRAGGANLRGLEIGLPSVQTGAVVDDLGVSSRRLLTQTPRAEAMSRRAARGCPILKSGIARPGGRIFSADSSLACRCPVYYGLLPRPLADKPAPRC